MGKHSQVALRHLLSKEYTMGCMGSSNRGQCPECDGVHEGWLGHPLYLDSSNLGHEADCPLARSIRELGGDVVFIGESKLTDKYESFVDSRGFLNTRKIASAR